MSITADIVKSGSPAFGLSLSDITCSLFHEYYIQLNNRNKYMNLTAIDSEQDNAHLHFLDSLSLFLFSNFKDARVIDIGSGAGFPGLPIKLAEDSVDLTLLDATAKRVAFLSDLANALRLDNVHCIHARAEELAYDMGFREIFDFALSRAVAKLNVLCELCLPFVKPGGYFLAMKGTDSDEEILESAKAIKTLGGLLEPAIDYQIPGTEIVHRIVIIEKVAPTPPDFPRRFSRIQKSPL